jgi:hypothetical protein
MAMPRQLARGLWVKRHYHRREQRPLAECLPSINVNDLKIPKTLNTIATAPWISLRYPFISGLRLSAHMVEFAHSGRIQSFRLKWIKTGYGLPRFAFICECRRPVISLYFRHGNLSCRRCTNAIYASQICSGKQARSLLQANRIQAFLKFKPLIKHKARQRLQTRIRSLPIKPYNRQSIGKRINAKAANPQSNYNTQATPLWR